MAVDITATCCIDFFGPLPFLKRISQIGIQALWNIRMLLSES